MYRRPNCAKRWTPLQRNFISHGQTWSIKNKQVCRCAHDIDRTVHGSAMQWRASTQELFQQVQSKDQALLLKNTHTAW